MFGFEMNQFVGTATLSFIFAVAFAVTMLGCTSDPDSTGPKGSPSQMAITNAKVADYGFLEDMYADDYYPDFLVDKCREILVNLCVQIETWKPSTDAELFQLTHAATELINSLADEFDDHDSELETGAREALGKDFTFIAEAYGFDVDTEEVMAPREW